MTDHVEYLTKVAVAKRSLEEYVRTGATVYYWAMLLGCLGVFVFPVVPLDNLYTYFSLAIGVTGGLMYLYKTEKNRKEFPKKFPEAERIIAEYEELLK